MCGVTQQENHHSYQFQLLSIFSPPGTAPGTSRAFSYLILQQFHEVFLSPVSPYNGAKPLLLSKGMIKVRGSVPEAPGEESKIG